MMCNSINNTLFQKLCYYLEIALTGHCDSHRAQSMHVSVPISYWASPLDIALTGHSDSHRPHEMQSVLITYAIFQPPFIKPSKY